jgi:hypothetical protein
LQDTCIPRLVEGVNKFQHVKEPEKFGCKGTGGLRQNVSWAVETFKIFLMTPQYFARKIHNLSVFYVINLQ